ncbi:MAG: hypothetical protein GX442_10160 [Candidatus Riflebacteria bacterium]|nr:hypothetical protein [Candidatus Riflebacteria bacterium]
MQKHIPVVVILLCLAVATAATAEDGITFQLLRGRAALSRTKGGTWLELGPEPVVVQVQDMLRTEGETRGELKFPDGSLFRVKSNSLLTLLSDGLQLQVGESWFNLRKQGRTFQVITPTTVCGVLGTTFDVAVDKFGRTQVRVYEGLVGVRARDDQRRRQIVLQRGMQTSVRDRGYTGDQVQKFDPGALESELKKQWESGAGGAGLKVGPERQGLPPIRPSLPGKIRPLGPDGQPLPSGPPPAQPRPDAGPQIRDIRDRMNFFEDLRQQRVREREALAGRGLEAPAAGDQLWKQPYPGLPFGTGGKPVSDPMLREGHGRPFGQATAAPTGAQDERMLRERILETQNQLVRVQEEIRQLESELPLLVKRAEELTRAAAARQRVAAQRAAAVRSQTPSTTPSTTSATTPSTTTGSTISPESLNLAQVQERIQQIRGRLQALQDQQRMLIQRMNDLRNRLR